MPRPPVVPPELSRLRQLMQAVADAPNRLEARPRILALRAETRLLRAALPPLVASLLARVSRHAEAASGAVIEKSRRVAEMQEGWETLIKLLSGM